MPITHKWNGTVLTITSDSGSTSMDLKGEKGDDGARGAQGVKGERGGGALINDNVISKDEVWSSSAIMDRFAEAMSYEGNPVVCNPLPNAPFDITTNIEVKQEGSGTPYPAGGGKNLYDKNTYPFESLNQYAPQHCITKPILLNAGTYTFTGVKDIGSANYVSSYATYEDALNSANALSQYAFPVNFTNTYESDVYIRLQVNNVGETNYSVCSNQWQIEKGSTASPYEPYENIRPIVGMDAVKIVRSGKNLTPFAISGNTYSNAGVSGTFDNSGLLVNGTPTTSYAKMYNEEIYLPKGQYYVSGGEYKKAYIQVSVSKGAEVKHYSNASFEITGEETKIQIMIQTGIKDEVGTLSNYRLYPMLVSGETKADNYEPYKANTYTMELGKTVYGGSIDWNRGVMIANWACETLDGNTPLSYFGYATNGNISRFGYVPFVDVGAANTAFICSHFKGVVDAGSYTDVWTVKANPGEPRMFFMLPVEINSVNMFNQWLAENPIQIAYKLAEPQEIQLTPQVIRALSGTNTLYTDASNLLVFGRVDTMATIKALEARIAALEAAGGE